MFGLFNSTRAKAAKAGIAAVRPLLGSLQTIDGPGIPPGLWEDPYILGYVAGTAAMFAKMCTGGKAQGPDLSHALLEVFSAVTNMNALMICQHINELLDTKHPAYVRGCEDATVTVMYGHGILKDDADHPLLTQAMTNARATGHAGDKAAIGSNMVMASWHKEVRRLAAEAWCAAGRKTVASAGDAPSESHPAPRKR